MLKLNQVTDLLGITKTREPGTDEAERNLPDVVKVEELAPKEVFLTWSAPSRPVKTGFNSSLNRTFMIIGIVIALILVILQEFFLILVIASLIFVTHVLSETPPDNVSYEVSSHGLMIDNQQFYWQEMRRFFFSQEEGHDAFVIEMASAVTSRLYITTSGVDVEKLKSILLSKIHFLQVPPESFLDKTYKSVLDKFNI
ncbi:hypothetical protein C4561_03605 [candidate division WWE3 bacterium]|jgi:hypothetical protein|uniref:DUF5673 domain-containing protein n=1 Tax=candidate division WWE3 bacterium TaxID=2053526 RepID=A0A3A4ZJW2_UNCKA|nr:MAG: hypothetical protein C4561_03605 [candidate division WWE3 bacterium]